MAIDIVAIRAFLNRPGVEGPQALRGYIPCYRVSDNRGRNYIGPDGTNPAEIQYPSTGNPAAYTAMGVSGVTVGTGVDLGQTDADTLGRSGLDDAVLGVIRPYLGQKKDAALRVLYALPLLVMRDEANALDTVTHGIHARTIASRYNRDAPKMPFESLPPQAQTAIFSLLYQRGTGVAAKEHEIWMAFLHGDWARASALLKDPGHWVGSQAQYQIRRRMEGDLLAEIA